MNLLRLGFLIESKHELPDTFSITITLPLEDRKVFDSFKVGDVIELTEKIVERK